MPRDKVSQLGLILRHIDQEKQRKQQLQLERRTAYVVNEARK